MFYQNTKTKHERIKFELTAANEGIGTLQRFVGGDWRNLPGGPHYYRKFDKTPHSKHLSAWGRKIVEDSEYAEEFKMTQQTEIDELAEFFGPAEAEALQRATALPAQPEGSIEDMLGYEPAPAELFSIGGQQPAPQQPAAQPPAGEAQASVTVKLFGESGADIMLTLRGGCTADQAKNLLDTLAGALVYAKNKYKLTPVRPTVGQQPAAGVPQTTNGTEPTLQPLQPAPAAPLAPAQPVDLSVAAEELEVATAADGTPQMKVKGPAFKKFGLRVWPEALQAAGLPTAPPAGRYSLTGYVAHYVTGDNGKPLKVTSLQRAA